MSRRRVIVIGGGPAGMMAAISAAEAGASAVLLERNEKLGKKLFLTGKGRCNLTNAADIEDFFGRIPRNPRFLYSALYSYTNLDLIKDVSAAGTSLKTERGGRVFPESDKSADVLRALKRMVDRSGAEVRLGERVRSVSPAEQGVTVTADHGVYRGDCAIIATGGVSYSATGSTGDGHRLARDTGHTVTDLCASLVPLTTEELYPQLQGLALKNVGFSLREGKKRLFSGQGELLLTHFGLSGPLVLQASAHLRDYGFKDTLAVIDLKPALDEGTLDARLLRDIEGAKNRSVRNALSGLLPHSLLPVALERAGVDGDKQANSLTKAERSALIGILKAFSFRVTGTRPVEEAIITRGGVSVKDIDPSTMESKVAPGIYFAGEVIDVDAYTGGYNLQIAFSTGRLAGRSAGEGREH